MMNGAEFITATDGKQYYIENFLKSIIYGYHQLLSSKRTYSRNTIQKKIREILKSDKAHNEIEDFLCTDLIANYVKPNLHLFGLNDFVVNNGVRETKENVTVGHLDIKFELPNLGKNHYYAFEAKRVDKNAKKQDYYISGGIERFTKRTYYPETDTLVAGMLAFVEIDLIKSPKARVPIQDIKKAIDGRIIAKTSIKTSQNLSDHIFTDHQHPKIESFKFAYISKHIREDDKNELTIYHLFLDYYDLLLN